MCQRYKASELQPSDKVRNQNSHITKFIDDERDAAPPAFLQRMTNDRVFPAPEKYRNNSCRYF